MSSSPKRQSSSPRRSTRSQQSTPAKASDRSSSPARESSPVGSPQLYNASSSSPVHRSGGAPSSPGGAHDLSSPLPYGSQTTPVSTPRRSDMATPRSDLGQRTNRMELDLTPGGPNDPPSSSSHDGGNSNGPTSGHTSEVGPMGRTVVWGTSVSMSDTKATFREFISTFTEESDDQPKYERMIAQLGITNKTFLNLDCRDLMEYDLPLYKQLLTYPAETIGIFDMVLQDYITLENIDLPFIQVRTFNLGKSKKESKSMRELNPDDIDQLIALPGMVIRVSPIIPDMKEAFFKCTVCNHTTTVEIENGFIAEPTACNSCSTQKSYELVHNRCRFTDKQMIKLQETPEMIPDGATPQTALIYCYDELVDTVQPGDRVEVTGIYRATPLRVMARQRTVKSIYKTHLDALHFNKSTGNRVRREGAEDEEEDPARKAAEEKAILELSEEPDVYERLSQALAPNINEFEDVKKGVLLQLVGGSHKDFTQSGRGRFRGELNILLVGDPGTAKSQMLQYAVKLAPRGLYTSGKGSSSVGLTAYVTKDPETRQLVLESGALVLCDGGICCIDEFDKMPDSTRSVLHEAMEQQTVSIAKAGIICSLNARTSILAAANPIDSRWNPNRSIVENVQLPPTLLSRFDLIYLILDQPDETRDRQLATHLVKLYYRDADAQQAEADLVNRDLLAKYISYARENVQPKLSQEAATDLVQAYAEMRKLGGGKNTVTATPRQLESLIRLSEAHARIRLSDIVESKDVAEAERLVRTAIRQAATDPRTGQIDMDLLTTGQSAGSLGRIAKLADAIYAVLETSPSFEYELLLQKMKGDSLAMSVSRDDYRSAMERMEADDRIVISGGGGGVRTVRLLQANA